MAFIVGTMMIEGAPCTSLFWWRFSLKKTKEEKGLKLCRDLVLNNIVNRSIRAPCTNRQIVETIASLAEKPIPIESLPEELNDFIHPRGALMYGFPGKYFDRVARNYDDMQWWISGKGLKMEVIKSSERHISSFDEIAGGLMAKTKPHRLANGRLPVSEYMNIAIALDQHGFKPVETLQGAPRNNLARWNQKNPHRAIHTFKAALNSKLPWLNTGVKRRLYHATETFRRVRPELSEM